MTSPNAPIAVVCRTCREHGRSAACDLCLGAGVVWNDGAPFTFCPSTWPSTANEDRCGRRAGFCKACERINADFPTPEDITRARAEYAKRIARGSA